MATRLVCVGVVLAALSGVSVQAQELLAQPAAAPMQPDSPVGVEGAADLIRAADHLEAAGAADLARHVRHQARLILKRETKRLFDAQSRLQQLLDSLPELEFRISAVIAEVRETTAQDLRDAIHHVAGERAVGHAQDSLIWTVDCGCGSELIERLRSDDESRIKVVSRPHVIALDGQEASILVGESVPTVQGVTLVDGQVSPVVKAQPFGIEFTVMPRAIDGETARYDVQMEHTVRGADGAPIFTDPASGIVVSSPVIDGTAACTAVELKSGGTLVMALPSKLESSAEETLLQLLLIATPALVERD